jgi:hypothetical protein
VSLLLALVACSDDGDEPIVVFDGQSLNRVPVPDYPALVMQGIEGAEAENIAVNGASWTLLSEDVETRRDPLADEGYSILVMVGGTSDVVGGDDGPTIYEDMRSYAGSARDAGYDHIIAATIQPGSGETDAQNRAREDANELILEDPDGAFDEVVDLAGQPGLKDPTSDFYYDPIGHPSPQGARRMADAMRPAVEDAIDEATSLLG